MVRGVSRTAAIRVWRSDWRLAVGQSCREQCAEVVHGLSSPPWIPKSAGIGPTKWNNMKSGINRVETMNMVMIWIECFDLYLLLTSDDRHDCSDHGDQNDPRIPHRCWAWSLGVFHWQDSNCIFKRCFSDGFPRLIGKIVIMGSQRCLVDGKSWLVSSCLAGSRRCKCMEILAFNRFIPYKNAIIPKQLSAVSAQAWKILATRWWK